MDTRADSFVKKFSSTQRYLRNDSIQNIVSLKFRDEHGSVNSSTYREFFSGIQRMNIQTEEIKGDFQGNAFLITGQNSSKAILVEHETGLEILYIAGSIASIISLIPMIGSAWQRIRSGFRRPYEMDIDTRLEKRTLDLKNQVIEEYGSIFETYLLRETLSEFLALEKRVKQLEQQLAEYEKNKVKPQKITKTPKKVKK